MKVTEHPIFHREKGVCFINRWIFLCTLYRVTAPCFVLDKGLRLFSKTAPFMEYMQAVSCGIYVTRQNQHGGEKSQPKILFVPQVF